MLIFNCHGRGHGRAPRTRTKAVLKAAKAKGVKLGGCRTVVSVPRAPGIVPGMAVRGMTKDLHHSEPYDMQKETTISRETISMAIL